MMGELVTGTDRAMFDVDVFWVVTIDAVVVTADAGTLPTKVTWKRMRILRGEISRPLSVQRSSLNSSLSFSREVQEGS